jgi:glycosyltransferase involved in cell wall biosynthesis
MWGDPKRFVVGCVARNNPRKMLPRLIKAFRRFINPSTTCPKCGEVIFTLRPQCVVCGDAHVMFQGPKDDAMLYLHTVPDDPAGHKLLPLLERFDLLEKTGMPEHMVPGRGVSDSGLNEVYNALDLHTIPTGGEGFGLPLLEGMAAGIPTLATHYSGHVDFMKDGAGEFIAISDFETCTANNGERALVDLDDYVLKLDRCYYEHDKFVAKWGPRMLITGGFTQEQVDGLITGKEFLRISGQLARERALDYRWEPIIEKWSTLFYRLLNRNWAQEQEADPRSNLSVEVLT